MPRSEISDAPGRQSGIVGTRATTSGIFQADVGAEHSVVVETHEWIVAADREHFWTEGVDGEALGLCHRSDVNVQVDQDVFAVFAG